VDACIQEDGENFQHMLYILSKKKMVENCLSFYIDVTRAYRYYCNWGEFPCRVLMCVQTYICHKFIPTVLCCTLFAAKLLTSCDDKLMLTEDEIHYISCPITRVGLISVYQKLV
jgi:hypothetical protein